jgi:hypothetical protein
MWRRSGRGVYIPSVSISTAQRRCCDRTSPTARYFPSALKDTQVAAFTRSLAVHVLPLGESDHSDVVGEKGTPPSVDSRPATLFLNSEAGFVGVVGPYTVGMGLRGMAVGRARKNRCLKLSFSSKEQMTAAAPAVKARCRFSGRVATQLAQLAVVPTTCRRERPVSLREILEDFGIAFAEELAVGVNRTPQGPTLAREGLPAVMVARRRCQGINWTNQEEFKGSSCRWSGAKGIRES